MQTPDTSSAEVRLRGAWFGFTNRLAAVVGTSAALLSLFHDAPVLQASLRGGLALIGMRIVARLGWVALKWSALAELNGSGAEEEALSVAEE